MRAAWELSAEAVNHGSAATTAAASVMAAHSQRGRPAPGAVTQTSATVAASINPVGVSPANAIHHASAKYRDRAGGASDRSISIVVATQGRQP